jgi:glycosyltransferase involved in cell wall biosynthesis
MKIIILHDYFESLEGGGRLSSILAKGLKAEIGYGFARHEHPFLSAFKEKSTKMQTTQAIQNPYDLQAKSVIPLWQQFQLTRAFTHRTTFLKNYDTVIYSGFYTPLAIRHHPHGRNILYCHTPPRFIYDQRDFYLKQLPFWLRPALQTFISYLQPRYENAIKKMDTIITNSDNVRKRIQHYLNRDAMVIHPPCETAHFTWQGQDDYYLSMGRLDPLKRVNLIIQAFLKMPDKRLIVTSSGSELKKLQKLAKNAPHIIFTGAVDDIQLATLIGNAIATIYLPIEEDFGMSPLESMAAGKPVIGVYEGGLIETVIPEKTGILLKNPLSIEAIYQAVQTMTPKRALSMRTTCEQQAQRFQTKIFLERMRQTTLESFNGIA